MSILTPTVAAEVSWFSSVYLGERGDSASEYTTNFSFHLLYRPSFINPLNTKRRLRYLKTQFVPRSKHFSSRL